MSSKWGRVLHNILRESRLSAALRSLRRDQAQPGESGEAAGVPSTMNTRKGGSQSALPTLTRLEGNYPEIPDSSTK